MNFKWINDPVMQYKSILIYNDNIFRKQIFE